jgi:hypothetical protein
LGADPYTTWEARTSERNAEADIDIPQSTAADVEPSSSRAKLKQYLKLPLRTRRSPRKHNPQGENEGVGREKSMWIRDLLVPQFPYARIASYSYKSHWKNLKDKTILRECAETFLNILSHHQQQDNVSVRYKVLVI